MRPQLRRAHPGHVVPRQPHAAEHVDLEEPQPVLVGDLLERLRLEDAHVVDEDVHVGSAATSRRTPRRCRGPPRRRRPSRRDARQPGWPDAWLTRSCVRPFTVTCAPSRASARAAAKPMPAVEPVTSARFPVSPRSMHTFRERRHAFVPQPAGITESIHRATSSRPRRAGIRCVRHLAPVSAVSARGGRRTRGASGRTAFPSPLLRG